MEYGHFSRNTAKKQEIRPLFIEYGQIPKESRHPDVGALSELRDPWRSLGHPLGAPRDDTLVSMQEDN